MRPSNLKKSVLATNIALMLGTAVSMSAVAAEADSAPTADENIEKIEVRGMRASMKASVNAKRFSDSVVDAVTAEDIGKFPDGDVGESLGRIPGVAVNRQFGQGQQVSIRGASSQLTRTLLNGHSVASTGWFDQQAIDRSFNYSLLPPQLVSGIEVYKSSQADITEGGIGGTVIVKTRKPLDLDSNTVFVSAKGDYGTISEEIDPELSGLYSWKNEDENFGILVAGAGSQTEYQRNGIETLLGWGEIVPSTFQQDRERTAFNVAAQYRPTEALEFGLTYTALDLKANNANTSIFLFPTQQGVSTCNQTNAAGVCTDITHTGEGGFAWAQTWAREAEMTSDTIDFDFNFEAENFTVDGRIGNTTSDGGTSLTSNYGNSIGQPGDFAGHYDATGKVIDIDIANKHFGAEDFNGELSSAAWALKKQPNTDEETYAQLNFTIPVELGAITSFKTGIRYADHDVTQQTDIATVGDIAVRDASHYYSGTMSSGAGFTLPKPNFDAMIADANAAITGFERDKSGYGTLNEKNLALYAMASFESEGIRGNFGLRYISTDVESDYYELSNTGQFADNLSTAKSSYDDVLPSINVAFDLTSDLILRTSAAQVISRPNYSELFATSTLPGLNDGTPGNEKLNRGSVSLDPFKATQADVSLEWYFSGEGLAAITYFIKDVNSFISTRQKLNQQIGIEDNDLIAQGGSACGVGVYDCWTVSEKYNATGGRIEGVELQLQDSFESGLGYSVNYTYADAGSPAENYPDQVGVFSDSSKHTVNLVGYYEMESFSARLAYNWRSEYMMRELPGFYGNRQHEDYGTLDLSASYSVTEWMDVTFEAVNLTEEDSIQTGVAPLDAEVIPEFKADYPVWSFEGEARYKVGVAFRF
ncbi:TonB-dependent receptor [Shewanella fidelis]|uniref:TonB-dependent receptor n=1 Tax=Shewanella fidelis TaxID=173509 RepID=A0AAW8NPR5_9GAMM|nr:TonB-dependent receptor [Shewanella fidelis]MDR8524716.1 TonB-dependent receptor [Shewanella fidelis]MDW4810787.1 TonB-dependent receptor [Shewanella fidelis]MDW4815434.1 TonB-dependent receptor [Shewanella fidelis]MDW4819524.1 TonB-dependent receptor [Shewanella fidelis]MDW4822798.1 TonB-dependent receptor [Shewanella fidelis]